MKENIKYSICFKTCVPNREDLFTWGDYYLVKSLGDALLKLGHDYTIQTISEWYKDNDNDYNVVIHVRGLTSYRVKSHHFNIMWNISHPDAIPVKEYNKYDMVLFASRNYRDQMKDVLDVPTGVLLQFTDPNLFFYDYDETYNTEILFVGNSRKKYRTMVNEAINNDLNLTVIGNDWVGVIDEKYINSNWFPNHKLRLLYSSSRIILNDHWNDMKENGFINNRLFDALACKAIVINDENFEIKDVFPDAIVYGKENKDLKSLIDQIYKNFDVYKKKAERLQKEVLNSHTADSRAIELLNYIGERYQYKTVGCNQSFLERMKINIIRNLGYGRVYKFLKKPYKWLKNKKYQLAYYRSLLRSEESIGKGDSKVICFLVSEGDKTVNGDFFSAKALGDALKRKYGYIPIFLSKERKYKWNQIPRDADIVISMLHDTNLKYINIPVNAKKIAWIRSYGDEWINNPSIMLYDGILTSSKHWAIKVENNAELKNKFWGIIPLAFSGQNLIVPNDIERDIDVCFVGNIFEYERQITRDLDLNQGFNFHFYGKLVTDNKHPWRRFHKGVLDHSKIFDIYRRSKIVIEDNTPMTSNTINLRTYEAAGCGSLIITNESEAIRELLGNNVVFYRDKTDLSNKIKFYLENPELRIKIANKAKEIIQENHTFSHRAEEVHKIINLKK